MNGEVTLSDKNNSTILRFDPSNIIYTKNHYEYDTIIKEDDLFKEFDKFWTIINKVIKITSFRRVGIVAENRIEDNSNISGLLKSKLIRIDTGHDVDSNVQLIKNNLTKSINEVLESNEQSDDTFSEFTLRWMERENRDSNKPHNMDEYDNYIYEIYDSKLDSTNPASGCFNFNIDAQEYYLRGKVIKNMTDHVKSIFRKKLTKKLKILKKTLKITD